MVCELVATRVRCFLCRSSHTVGLEADAPIRPVLARRRCPRCNRTGGVQLEAPLPTLPTPPPQRIGPHDKPDELGDEEMLADRARSRRYT